MDHADHVGLIRAGVEGAGRRWLELGAGRGAFTLALADLLGPGAEIVAVDRDGRDLADLATTMGRRFPETDLTTVAADFSLALPVEPGFDGLLAANSLHFVRDPGTVIEGVRPLLRPGARIVVVEYDSDSGNPWVPSPFSFASWGGDRRERRTARHPPGRPGAEPFSRGDVRGRERASPRREGTARCRARIGLTSPQTSIGSS